MPLGACSGGSRQAAATKGGDEQGAAGRGDDGGKGKKQAEETTAAKEGEKNGDGKGRRRGEETAATKEGGKKHAHYAPCAVRGGCGKGALMGALRFVGV